MPSVASEAEVKSSRRAFKVQYYHPHRVTMLGIIGLLTALASIIIESVLSSGFWYRRVRFGSTWGAFLYAGRIINTDTLQQNHWDINSWTDPEVLTWKASHLASCNAIAVAVCICRAL